MRDTSVQLAQMLPLIQERLAAGESVQFTPQGISMRPTIYGGRDQVVLVAPPAKLKKYDLPLFRRDDGHFVLHRIVRVGETYTCIGDNQLVYEPGVRLDQIIALAVGVHRKGKYYRTNSLGYRAYVRFWCWTRIFRRALFHFKRLWRAISGKGKK